jgi:site-specific DNA recombinase
MKVALYARVSTALQEEEETIVSQLAALQAYAQATGDEVSADWIFRDEGYSGSTLSRPGLDALRDVVQSGSCGRILVYDPDRLARSYVHQAVLLEEWQRGGVEVIFLNRPQAAETPEEKMLLEMQGVFAEFERAKILERLRRGRLHQARQGGWVPNVAPYGYRRQPAAGNTPARLEIYEPEAEVVRELFRRLIEEGASTRALVRWLNGPPVHLTAQGHTQWSTSVVGRMVTNSLYMGVAYMNRYQVVEPARPRQPYRRQRKSVKQLRPEEEWIAVPVPAVITAEEFALAQAQLQRNRDRAPRRNHRYRYLVRGLLRCGVCGLAWVGKRGVYGCKGHDPLSVCRETPCASRGVKAEVLDGAVWDSLVALLQDPQALLHAYQRQCQAPSLTGEPWTQAQERVARSLQQLTREEQRLWDAYQVGMLSLEALQARLAVVQQRRTGLEGQQQALQQEARLALQSQAVLAHLERFSQQVRENLAQATFEEQRRLVELVVDQVVVTDEIVKVQHIIPLPTEDGTLCPPFKGRGPGG